MPSPVPGAYGCFRNKEGRCGGHHRRGKDIQGEASLSLSESPCLSRLIWRGPSLLDPHGPMWGPLNQCHVGHGTELCCRCKRHTRLCDSVRQDSPFDFNF